MTEDKVTILALDIGEKRIGVAFGDTETRIPAPLTTISVDGLEIERLRELIAEHQASLLVVGLPRNQSGDITAQTHAVKKFVRHRLNDFHIPIKFQDESVTSVLAEEYLRKNQKNYTKADIDMYAAAIILGDYLEGEEKNYGY